MAKRQLARNSGALVAAAAIGLSAVGFAKPQVVISPEAAGAQESSAKEHEAIRKIVDEANLFIDQGNYNSAIKLWEQIVQIEINSRGPDHPTTATSLNNLAFLYNKQGAYAKAEALYLRALEISEKGLGQDHSATAISLVNLASLYINQGAYAKAMPLLVRSLAVFERASGHNHPLTATTLNNLAVLYSKQGAYTKAEPLLQRALAVREVVLGANHPDTATTLNNLALVYVDQGSYVKAEPLYQRALAIAEKTQGANHPDTASSLNNLASLYEQQGNYSKAEPLYLRALSIRENVLGTNHPATSNSLNNIAGLYKAKGSFAKAESFYLRALDVTEKALGPDNPDTATIINNLAVLYEIQGFYAKSEPLLQRALSIREMALGANHPTTATSLNNLGSFYDGQGAYSKAEPLFRRALAINELSLGASHTATAKSLNNLAMLYMSQGFYSMAEQLFLRALVINEKALGSDHPATATSVSNLAALYQRQGATPKAESLYLRALVITEKALGPDHPSTATRLNNLASIYESQGAYAKAESLYLRALVITEKALGPDHPSTATRLNNLAGLYRVQGIYAKAKPLSLRALTITEQALGADHPSAAISLNNLAALYFNQGEYSKSQPLLLQALAIFENVLPSGHPDIATTLNNLAELYIAQNDYERAEPLARKEIHDSSLFLQRELPFLPEVRRRDQIKSLGKSHKILYGTATRFANGPSLAIFSRLNRHGLLQEIELRQSLLARAHGPQRELKEQITGLTNRLAAINLSQPQRQSLQQQKSELEQQLYRLLPALQPRVVEVDQVAKVLPTDGVLVEFQRYQAFDEKKPAKERWGSPRYLALILQPSGATAAVELGEAAPVDAAIAAAISATAQSQSDAEQLWATVSKLVLTPLQPHLGSRRQWFFSPDGELNRVPFAALPSPGAPGKTVGNSVNLRLLTTGRDLLRFQTPVARGQAPLVMANPSFDRKGARATAAPAQQSPVSASQQRSTSLDSKTWAPLPATAVEGKRIAALLRTQPLTDAAATVQRLQSSPSPRIVHIASHGFFAADQETKPTDPLVAVMEHGQQLAGFVGEDPMLRSGLVLAGANQPDADRGDDGYLTAAEATALQLDGTELVVLSACSTGQGDIRTGEGVYGLQRALTVAGARTTLLSLWKVDDKATAAFMEAFYTRLKGGAGRADALAATQADFRNHPNIAWRHPYYWAAWQLTGDWRPIPGL